jgi:hypothetical protein
VLLISIFMAGIETRAVEQVGQLAKNISERKTRSTQQRNLLRANMRADGA